VEVLIKRRGFDELESVRVLRKGESFGELALIHRQPRLATIRCVSDCAFAVLDK
jgi:CRP-like cAMP-binding protein